jgi:hypothetical protein
MMKRVHMTRRLTLGLLGTGLVVGGVTALHASSPSSKLTAQPDTTVRSDNSTSVSSNEASKPTVTIDGTEVPIPDKGRTTVDLGDDKQADVAVHGSSMSVDTDTSGSHQGSATNNGSTQVNVNSSTSSSDAGDGGRSRVRTSSRLNVRSTGDATVKVSH